METGSAVAEYDSSDNATSIHAGQRIGIRPFDAKVFFNFISRPTVRVPRYFSEMLSSDSLRYLERSEYAHFITVNQKPILFGGVTPRWVNRCEAYAFVDYEECYKHRFAVQRMCKKYLGALPFNRIEATTERGFLRGYRWLEALGFSLEAECMKSYYPDGKDHSLFARVKEESF